MTLGVEYLILNFRHALRTLRTLLSPHEATVLLTLYWSIGLALVLTLLLTYRFTLPTRPLVYLFASSCFRIAQAEVGSSSIL